MIYNINIQHTRLPFPGARRTLHHYFSCTDSPALTDWVMIPQRLTEHSDPELRAYFSQWPEATAAYAAAGYSTDYYQAHVMGKR